MTNAQSRVFSGRWLWGVAAITLLGAVLRESVLILIGLLTLLTIGGGWLWSRAIFRNVVVARTLRSERVFPGEQVTLQIHVINRKLLPLAWLKIEDQLPSALQIVEQGTHSAVGTAGQTLRITTAIRWYEQVTWTFHLTCPVRGCYTLGPISLQSGDLFGLFTVSQHIEDSNTIMVYPRIISLDQLDISARQLFGDQRVQRRIVIDPSQSIGVRDYRPEDSIRHIHWAATARAQKLQTKVFEPSTSVQQVVFLNLDTHNPYWEGLDSERAENAITVAATIAIHALRERQVVGVYASGMIVGSDQPLRIRASRNPTQASAILTGLARLSPIAAIDFPGFLQAESAQIPAGSTIVIVTAVMTDRLAAIMADLHRMRRRLVLVAIGEVAIPPIRGLDRVCVDEARLNGAHITDPK